MRSRSHVAGKAVRRKAGTTEAHHVPCLVYVTNSKTGVPQNLIDPGALLSSGSTTRPPGGGYGNRSFERLLVVAEAHYPLSCMLLTTNTGVPEFLCLRRRWLRDSRL